MSPALVLVDGSSYLFRAYHALPALTTFCLHVFCCTGSRDYGDPYIKKTRQHSIDFSDFFRDP